MGKLLLTGFEPFLDNGINPTQVIVGTLNGQEIGAMNVIGKVLPVDFSLSAKNLIKDYEAIKPDVVLMLGLAAGRRCITPERVAINCNDGARDNEGNMPIDQAIVPDGPAAYFSTLPIRKMVNQLKDKGLPADISNTAGTYLCNNVMYSMLHHLAMSGETIPAGFVHVPASHELVLSGKNIPSWSTQDLIAAIKIVIESL